MLREAVAQDGAKEVREADLAHLNAFGESVSLAWRRQRVRMQRRHDRLRALRLSVIWAALMAVTLLLVLVQWILLRLL
jgi:hypothetical protein